MPKKMQMPCPACSGQGGRYKPKLEESKQMINDPSTGKRELVKSYRTVQTWEPCKTCKGLGA